jgi:hypothetical protein
MGAHRACLIFGAYTLRDGPAALLRVRIEGIANGKKVFLGPAPPLDLTLGRNSISDAIEVF